MNTRLQPPRFTYFMFFFQAAGENKIPYDALHAELSSDWNFYFIFIDFVKCKKWLYGAQIFYTREEYFLFFLFGKIQNAPNNDPQSQPTTNPPPGHPIPAIQVEKPLSIPVAVSTV